MPVLGRFLVCQCGQTFREDRHGGIQYHGNDERSDGIIIGRWEFNDKRLRRSRSEINGDIIQVFFTRKISCGVCKSELCIEKKTFELTPDNDPRTSGNVTTFYGRQVILAEEGDMQEVKVAIEPSPTLQSTSVPPTAPLTPHRKAPSTNPMIKMNGDDDDVEGLVDLGGESSTGSSMS